MHFRNLLLTSFCSCAVFLSCNSFASDEVISVDRSLNTHIELAFPNDDNIRPELSEFEVTSQVLMSNAKGERWAVVTLKNLSSGRRTLNHKQVMAITAQGNRLSPHSFNQVFDGLETISLTIAFGQQKFPLLAVYTRNPN